MRALCLLLLRLAFAFGAPTLVVWLLFRHPATLTCILAH